ncbi:MAG: aldehyde dehydrogenase family protein, partial [Porticoccaceae bacterium]
MSQDLYNNYIKGEWVSSSAVIENINPSDTSDLVGRYAKATNEDCLAAIGAANAAFDDWSQSGLEQRKAVLDFIGAELIARSGEIGEILAREEGKTRAEGVGEVFRSGQFFQYYAAETLRLMGENTQSVRPGVDVEVHREPLGVIGI